MCGYKKNPRCLAFHHVDPTTKSDKVKNGYKGNPYNNDNTAGGMARLYRGGIPLKELFREIRLCGIVCIRCHGEITYSEYNQAI